MPLSANVWQTIVCFLTVLGIQPCLHAAQSGQANEVAWCQMGIDAARKCERPILLYLYNPQDMKLSTSSRERQVFDCLAVRQAFAQFTPVKLSFQTTSWPAKYTAHARDGVALVIMTCDANPVEVFTSLPEPVKDKKGRISFPKLCAAAHTALKANEKVALAVQKANLPADLAVDDLLNKAPANTGVQKKAGAKEALAAAGEEE